MFDISKKWTENDFSKRFVSMGGIVEKSGTNGWKAIVFLAMVIFPVNSQEGRGLAADNINFSQ